MESSRHGNPNRSVGMQPKKPRLCYTLYSSPIRTCIKSFCNLSYTSSSFGSDPPGELLLTFLTTHVPVTGSLLQRDPEQYRPALPQKSCRFGAICHLPSQFYPLKSLHLPVFPADAVYSITGALHLPTSASDVLSFILISIIPSIPLAQFVTT